MIVDDAEKNRMIWLSALTLQHPLADGALRIDARGQKRQDGADSP